MFKLTSTFSPTGDQPQAIDKLISGVKAGLKNQVLLGVTGSGKTFTMANVINNLNLPTLIISHNKTLAGQLYQEFRQFFPDNAVSYFVSYYDYYQPEAYMPQTDTYIEKEAQINELIDKLRLKSTTNILTGKDVIVVASVSCIYNIGSSEEFDRFSLEINMGEIINNSQILQRLVELQYERSEYDFKRGTFRVRGNNIDIYPAYEDYAYKITISSGRVERISKFEPLTGKENKSQITNDELQMNFKFQMTNNKTKIQSLAGITIYPAKHFMADKEIFNKVEKEIRNDLKTEHKQLIKQKKLLEAQRLLQRVNYDLEMIKEVGYVNGIENYSRYFDGREIGDPPYSLVNYFKEAYGDDWLLFIDESHMTVPQIRGMYNGDHARKTTLIDFGFRLKAAYDNRPMKFEEFYSVPKKIIYVSATPDEWEINKLKIRNLKFKHIGLVEQLVRPTGIVDPKIIIRPAENEVQDLICEIEKRTKFKQKILVTTLTKKIAEDLTQHLIDKNINAQYLHSDIKTLERSDVLDNLRKGKFDVLIGVNLLREGLDLPEVFLVAILDADREGFLRSKTALIQTMGRASRNIEGEIILYADILTKSIRDAISEIERRRNYQIEYNKKNKITSKTIYKPLRERIVDTDNYEFLVSDRKNFVYNEDFLKDIKPDSLTPYDKKRLLNKLERQMKKEAEDMNFELAIKIRDKVKELQISNDKCQINIKV